MKSNLFKNKLYWIYLTGFFVILALPILTLPPWFYPPDFGKTIIFRSVLAILLFLFAFQLLYRKNEFNLPDIKKNKIIWALAGFFIVFLLASVFSVDPYYSFLASPYRGGGFVTFAFYFIFAILAFILFKKGGWKKAWIFSIIIGILVSLIALIQFYGFFNNIFVRVGGRPGSTIGNPIFLGIYLLLLFFPTLSFAIKEKNRYLKIFYIFSLLLFLYVIFITGSRAAYLGIIAGVFYFLLFYPKKFTILKILTALFLILVASTVFYVNTQSHFPQVLQNNRLFQILESRLSIKAALDNERFRAWQTVLEEIKDKPILGWGPENLAVGFDKNYDSNITWSPWWDKAHNVFLDIGAQTGILGIIAYLALFVVLFWQLHKLKSVDKNAKQYAEPTLIAHGIQATLIGYLVANFFSFDTFATYLIFFFIIGYSLHLISSGTADIGENQPSSAKIKGKTPRKINKLKTPIIFCLFIILIIFLWQYNLVPFQINTQINIANNLTDRKKCDSSFTLMDKELLSHSFLDSYLIMQYITDIKKCAAINPAKDLVYAKKGAELLKEGVKIQPLYTRYWIYLGSFTTVIANNEQNSATKENLVKEAYSYFDKAETLSPLHVEIFIEKAKTDMVSANYQKMKSDAEKCIKINPNLGGCYWTKALAEMYLKENDIANEDIKTAKKYGFNDSSTLALYQLIGVYNKTEQYDKLADVYEKLIVMDLSVAQYHSSLAFTYFKLGQYKKAREQAMIFLKLMPEAKDEVDAFLRMLPY